MQTYAHIENMHFRVFHMHRAVNMRRWCIQNGCSLKHQLVFYTHSDNVVSDEGLQATPRTRPREPQSLPLATTPSLIRSANLHDTDRPF